MAKKPAKSPLTIVLGKEPLKAMLGKRPITTTVKFLLGKKGTKRK